MSHSENRTVQSGHEQAECTLEEAADRIAASPAPVLFLDTCSLVDLIRLSNPDRTDRSEVTDCGRELAAALALSEDQREQDLWVVVPPIVRREYREHAPKAADRVRKEWKRIDDEVHVSLFAGGVLDVSASLPSQTNFSQTLQPLLAEIKRIADGLIADGLWLESDDGCRDRAYSRTVQKIPPGHRGGEMKDCTIIEHALALSRLLAENGAAIPRVFLTSNTKDFCGGGSRPKPPLDGQFDDVGLQLAVQWQQAKAVL